VSLKQRGGEKSLDSSSASYIKQWGNESSSRAFGSDVYFLLFSAPGCELLSSSFNEVTVLKTSLALN